MEFDLEYSKSLGELQTLRGSDPVVQHLSNRGRPLTRMSYVMAAGLREPLDPETAAYLDKLGLA